MSNAVMVFNDEGIQELLHEVGSTVCVEHAERIAAACGDGYETSTHNAGKRTVASVTAFSGTVDPDEILRHLQ